jgi:hypothetical protein
VVIAHRGEHKTAVLCRPSCRGHQVTYGRRESGYRGGSEGKVTFGTFFLILIYTLTGAAALFINYMIWFVALPMIWRLNRETFQRIRDRRNSNLDTTKRLDSLRNKPSL